MSRATSAAFVAGAPLVRRSASGHAAFFSSPSSAFIVSPIPARAVFAATTPTRRLSVFMRAPGPPPPPTPAPGRSPLDAASSSSPAEDTDLQQHESGVAADEFEFEDQLQAATDAATAEGKAGFTPVQNRPSQTESKEQEKERSSRPETSAATPMEAQIDVGALGLEERVDVRRENVAKDTVRNVADKHPAKDQQNKDLAEPKLPNPPKKKVVIRRAPAREPPEQVKRPAESPDPKPAPKSPFLEVGTAAVEAEKSDVKMSREQLEKAKEKREKDKAAAVLKQKQTAEQIRRVYDKAQDVALLVGEKTGTFKLGETARERVEAVLDQAEKEADTLKGTDGKIKAPEGDSAARTVKVKAEAVGALRKLSAMVASKWEEVVTPKIREKLPEEYRTISQRALSTGALTVGVALLLLPLFIGGGGDGENGNVKAKKRAIEEQTAVLEQKLEKNRAQKMASSTSSLRSSNKNAAIKSPFPPEAEFPSAKEPTVRAPSSATSSQESGSAISSKSSSVSPTSAQGPSTVEQAATSPTSPAPSPVPAAPPTATVVRPATPSPAAPKVVTADTVLRAVKSSLGSRANLVASASFDSLNVEPTVILEVSKAFRSLSPAEQGSFADVCLRDTRLQGYEAVSIVEVGTDEELVHAGIDIDLGDEAANLKAQLKAAKQKVDSLAVQASTAESNLAATQERLQEAREEYLEEKSKLKAILMQNKAENISLTVELQEAREELAQMPDRLELEKRTEAAEDQTHKMEATVEMLGRQVTLARDAEKSAIEAKVEYMQTVEAALKDKADAMEDAKQKIASRTSEARMEAEQRIAEMQNKLDGAVAASESRVSEVLMMQQEREKQAQDQLASLGAQMQDALAKADLIRVQELSGMKASYEKRVAAEAKDAEGRLESANKSYAADISELKKQIANAEDERKKMQLSAAKELDDVRKADGKQLASEIVSREKTLAETISAKDAELKRVETSVRAKYESLLDEVRKQASANLDAYNAREKEARKALSVAEKKAESTAAQAAREKANLTSKIEALEAKLQARLAADVNVKPPASSAPAAVATEGSAAPVSKEESSATVPPDDSGKPSARRLRLRSLLK